MILGSPKQEGIRFFKPSQPKRLKKRIPRLFFFAFGGFWSQISAYRGQIEFFFALWWLLEPISLILGSPKQARIRFFKPSQPKQFKKRIPRLFSRPRCRFQLSFAFCWLLEAKNRWGIRCFNLSGCQGLKNRIPRLCFPGLNAVLCNSFAFGDFCGQIFFPSSQSSSETLSASSRQQG